MQNETQKTFFSSVFAKIILMAVSIVGLAIIIYGICLFMEYHKTQDNQKNNQTVKPIDQQSKNYWELEKKCDGDSCCLSSLKIMKDSNYKESDENGKCLDGFEEGGLRCENSLSWCRELPKKNEQEQSTNKWKVVRERYLMEMCEGSDCCLASLKVLEENDNYIKVYKNKKCSEGFSRNAMRCENSLEWCEPEYCFDDQNNRRKIGEVWSESSTMFMECDKYGSILGNYILSCGNEKLTVSSNYNDHYISPNINRTLSEPFYIVNFKESLKFAWIVNNKKYNSSSSGPGSFFVSCDNEKAAIFYSNIFYSKNYSGGHRIHKKIFIDNSFYNYFEFKKISCFHPDNEYPENFVRKTESLENKEEICEEIREKYQKLKEVFSDTSNWYTYRNKEFGFEVSCPFEVKCPNDWKHSSQVMDFSEDNCKITSKYISESESGFLGIDYCVASNDDSRCEKFEINKNVYASIDWGMENRSSSACIKGKKTNGMFMFYLTPNSQECKEFFNQILSTFKFID